VKNKIVKYSAKSSQKFLMKRIAAQKGSGFIKVGTFTDEIVWGNYSYIFSRLDVKKQKDFKRGMFLFGMVRKDAKKFLKENKDFKLPKKYSQIEYRGTLDENLLGKITGTDLNHAYWRIAYNKGIISGNTYLKGLDDKFKAVRLAALSTMGANKKYQIIKNGEITDDLKIIVGDAELQKVYMLIRYTCYRFMNQVKRKLGKDFLCYKTDCIYYIDTKQNRQKVNDFFKEKQLLSKQLE
jgi:hypothetical protein